MVESRGSRRFAVLFFVAAFAVLVLGRFLQPVDSVVVTVTAPFAAVFNGVASAIGDTVAGVVNGPRYRQENERLRHDLATLLRRNMTLQDAAHENAILRKLAAFDKENGTMTFLTARVIMNDPNTLGQNVIVNRGGRDGLTAGMTVVSQDSFFAGTIVSVLPTASKVQLLTNPSSTVGAMDMETRAQGVVIGQYGGLPQLRNVETSSRLRVGDFVVTSGQADLFPRNLLIGQIVAVHHHNEDLLQSADIQPMSDFGTLELTQIVRNFRPNVPTQLLKNP